MEDELKKIVYKYAGSDYLRVVMKRKKINYTKLVKGAKVFYILNRPDFGKIKIQL